jgi:hypothetical protein
LRVERLTLTLTQTDRTLAIVLRFFVDRLRVRLLHGGGEGAQG